VTKLDGTAKGGVVVAIARRFGLPIRFVGVGEQAEDFGIFDARAYVEGLLRPAAEAA
jgi:fused signal recognition particle receptor